MAHDFELLKEKMARRLDVLPQQLPRHIGIIMDGNGRWAKKQGKPRFYGHREGAKKIEMVCDTAALMGCECITLYCFSGQNWKRPSMEVDFLMQLFTRYLVVIREHLAEKNIRLLHFGRRDKLPEALLNELDETIRLSAANDGLSLALALNYGGREEIVDSVRKIAKKAIAGQIDISDINEEMISGNIYSANIPDPELIIRTSKELRTSNFLLWQSSYSEYYITETLWPDFSSEEMLEAVRAYASRQRRIGDIKPAEIR